MCSVFRDCPHLKMISLSFKTSTERLEQPDLYPLVTDLFLAPPRSLQNLHLTRLSHQNLSVIGDMLDIAGPLTLRHLRLQFIEKESHPCFSHLLTDILRRLQGLEHLEIENVAAVNWSHVMCARRRPLGLQTLRLSGIYTELEELSYFISHSASTLEVLHLDYIRLIEGWDGFAEILRRKYPKLLLLTGVGCDSGLETTDPPSVSTASLDFVRDAAFLCSESAAFGKLFRHIDAKRMLAGYGPCYQVE